MVVVVVVGGGRGRGREDRLASWYSGLGRRLWKVGIGKKKVKDGWCERRYFM